MNGMTDRAEIERLLNQTGRTLESVTKVETGYESRRNGKTMSVIMHQSDVIELLVGALKDALTERDAAIIDLPRMCYLCKHYETAMWDAAQAEEITLNALRDEIYQDALEHGLWEEDDLSDDLLDDCYDLIRDEVDELDGAIEEWARTGYHNHFAEELADVIIMSLSVAGKLGIDIDAAVKRKMEINKGRPWKHEGEKHEG